MNWINKMHLYKGQVWGWWPWLDEHIGQISQNGQMEMNQIYYSLIRFGHLWLHSIQLDSLISS